MASRWTHITMTVSNIERSIDFYTSFCELDVLRDRRREGGGTVWLGVKPSSEKYPTFVLVISEGEVECRIDHLGFQCDTKEEVDRIAQRASESGILISPPTDSGGSVGYWTMISDPDNHIVEFTFGQPLEGLK